MAACCAIGGLILHPQTHDTANLTWTVYLIELPKRKQLYKSSLMNDEWCKALMQCP